jgi:hypothetical protein
MSITSVNNTYFSPYNKTAANNTVNQAMPSLSNDGKPEGNPAVIVSISEEAKANSAETKKTFDQEMDEMRAEAESLLARIEDARKQGDSVAESYEILRKCLIIAMRIMKGDKVPIGDHRFLLEKDPELYSKAIMLKQHRENPEEHKRLSKDKDSSPVNSDTDSASFTAPQEEAASPETASEPLGELIE